MHTFYHADRPSHAALSQSSFIGLFARSFLCATFSEAHRLSGTANDKTAVRYERKVQ